MYEFSRNDAMVVTVGAGDRFESNGVDAPGRSNHGWMMRGQLDREQFKNARALDAPSPAVQFLPKGLSTGRNGQLVPLRCAEVCG